mmetsp:Transcript_32058/g.61970  ORF Transcript_32058/g.61970 Transcript_32058/m.61970 type:complete len:246 (+) Transcript_32058:761-1498(+)
MQGACLQGLPWQHLVAAHPHCTIAPQHSACQRSVSTNAAVGNEVQPPTLHVALPTKWLHQPHETQRAMWPLPQCALELVHANPPLAELLLYPVLPDAAARNVLVLGHHDPRLYGAAIQQQLLHGAVAPKLFCGFLATPECAHPRPDHCLLSHQDAFASPPELPPTEIALHTQQVRDPHHRRQAGDQRHVLQQAAAAKARQFSSLQAALRKTREKHLHGWVAPLPQPWLMKTIACTHIRCCFATAA